MEQNEPQKKEKETWYSLHSEQIRLIQWLLYHLNKYNKGEMKQTDKPVEVIEGKYTLHFE
jgi:hypothetical protein